MRTKCTSKLLGISSRKLQKKITWRRYDDCAICFSHAHTITEIDNATRSSHASHNKPSFRGTPFFIGISAGPVPWCWKVKLLSSENIVFTTLRYYSTLTTRLRSLPNKRTKVCEYNSVRHVMRSLLQPQWFYTSNNDDKFCIRHGDKHVRHMWHKHKAPAYASFQECVRTSWHETSRTRR